MTEEPLAHKSLCHNFILDIIPGGISSLKIHILLMNEAKTTSLTAQSSHYSLQ